MTRPTLQLGFSKVYADACSDRKGRQRKASKMVSIMQNALGGLEPLRLRDIACSTGFMSQQYAGAFREAVAIDVDEPAVQFAKVNNSAGNLEYFVMDSQRLVLEYATQNIGRSVLGPSVFSHNKSCLDLDETIVARCYSAELLKALARFLSVSERKPGYQSRNSLRKKGFQPLKLLDYPTVCGINPRIWQEIGIMGFSDNMPIRLAQAHLIPRKPSGEYAPATGYAPDRERRLFHQGRSAEVLTASEGSLTCVGSYPKVSTFANRVGMLSEYPTWNIGFDRRSTHFNFKCYPYLGDLISSAHDSTRVLSPAG
ncbi:MAG: hypothetical protein ACRERU_04860 [Methylococcales bacterium]